MQAGIQGGFPSEATTLEIKEMTGGGGEPGGEGGPGGADTGAPPGRPAPPMPDTGMPPPPDPYMVLDVYLSGTATSATGGSASIGTPALSEDLEVSSISATFSSGSLSGSFNACYCPEIDSILGGGSGGEPGGEGGAGGEPGAEGGSGGADTGGPPPAAR